MATLAGHPMVIRAARNECSRCLRGATQVTTRSATWCERCMAMAVVSLAHKGQENQVPQG